MELSSEQKEDPRVRDFTRKLNHHVTSVFLGEVVAVYEAGGVELTNSAGVVWNLVPCLSFTVTGTKEARVQKGVYESYKCWVPCHLCTVLYEGCDDMCILPEELAHREAKAAESLAEMGAAAASTVEHDSGKVTPAAATSSSPLS